MNKTSPQSASEQAYRQLLDTLAGAADVINGPLGARDERERCDGFRHLLRLASLATEQFIEKGNSRQPQFTRWMEAGRKLLGDNPWTIYDSAQIEGGNCYRIFGQRGAPTYVGFCVYGTKDNGDRCIVSNIDDCDMTFDADGSFELYLGEQRPADVANWLELTDDASDVMVRQYFLSNEHSQKAHYHIESLQDGYVAPVLDDGELAERINKAAAFIEETIHVETTISAFSAEATPVILRDGKDYEGDDDAAVIDYRWVAKAMPTPAILYSGSWMNELADDEAIIVTGRAPRARYWSIQLLSRWMESPDYKNHEVFFTPANTHLDTEGNFRIVVAHRDPGVPNWLNTTGLRNGNITFRALKAEEETLDVNFERVKLTDLSPVQGPVG